MTTDGRPPRVVQNLFRDAVDRVIETEVSPKKGEAREYSSFWEVAKAMQKRASRTRSRAREATRARVVNPLPVFFDKDGRTGASAVWWRDAFAVSAALDGDGGRAESEDAGPETELEYWRSRMAKFNSITEQLKGRECKVVLGVLTAAKSRVLKRWKLLDNSITDANNEAKDNVKYLFTLERFLPVWV